MAPKTKYSKSFYDDGLGDFLEWIDDEVLVHSETKKLTRASDDQAESQTSSRKKQAKKQKKLYGDNEILDKYVAPQKRLREKFAAFEESVDIDKKLEDRVRGLINRLAAQTMPFVASEFEKIYSSNPRISVNKLLFETIQSSIIKSNVITKRKLVAELMILVSLLDCKIGHDVGAYIVHKLVNEFESFYRRLDLKDEDKSMINIMGCLLNLYTIGLINSRPIFEMGKRICENDFRDASLQILLQMLKSVGFQLRKDDPQQMRLLIVTIQNCIKALRSSEAHDSRIEFMMNTLDAIKNNNINKIGNYGSDIDKETIESTLKSNIQRARLSGSLNDASYQDIYHSSNWYLLETRVSDDEESTNKKREKTKVAMPKTEVKICKVLGLNKPAERTIFAALLRVSDYVEASNIIIGYGYNHCSDAMLVCIQVAVHEKKYNPFHFNLINNLCKFNRRYKIAAKFAIQDKIRTLGDMPQNRTDIFKRLSFELVESDAIPITILKSIEWGNMSSSTKDYILFLVERISKLPSSHRQNIMSKIEKKSAFAGAMKTFISCFSKDCYELFDE